MKVGLLFSDDERETLRQKVRAGLCKRLWGGVLERAEDTLGAFTEERATEEMEENFANHRGKAIEAGFAYALTGEQKFAHLAKRICNFLLSRPFLKPPGGKPMDAELNLSDYSREMAIVYDWIHDELSENESREFISSLVRKAVVNPSRDFEFSDEEGARLLLRIVPVFSTRNSFDSFHAEGSRNNWDSVLSSALGVIGLVAEEPTYVRIAENAIKQYLEGIVDEEGCGKEGWGYINYGVSCALIFVEGLRRVLNKNLYTKGLLNSPNWAMSIVSPTWKGIVSFHDSKYAHWGKPSIMFRLASQSRNNNAQWLGEQLIKKEDYYRKPSSWFQSIYHINSRQEAVLSIIWYDPTLNSVSPKGPRYNYYYGNGWVALRSGYDRDATLLLFRSGPPTGAHTHLDNNSLILEAYGERLLVDSGVGSYTDPDYLKWDMKTFAHNSLLVNGKGQKPWRLYITPDGEMKGFIRKSPAEEPILYGGKIFNYQNEKEYVYFVGDATECYNGLERYHRHVIYTKQGYVSIMDEVIASEKSQFEWRLFTDNRDRRAKIEISNDLIRLRRPRANLLVKIIQPKAHYAIGNGRLDGKEKGTSYLTIQSKPRKKRETLFMTLYPVRTGEPEPVFSQERETAVVIDRQDRRDIIEFTSDLKLRLREI